MLLSFEQRLSLSPLIERVWTSRSTDAGSFVSMAEPNLELVVSRVAGRAQVILRGPVTRASVADCPANGQWLGIRFSIGTYLPELPTAMLRDHQSLLLQRAGPDRFWLSNQSWEIPTYDSAEWLVACLAIAGVIAHDQVVDHAIEAGKADLGLRSVQRRFLRATGLTRTSFLQIERARHAAFLLRNGEPIGDVVGRAGYFDQPHLTRALRKLIGPTPKGLIDNADQLSLLYKTRPPLDLSLAQ